MRTKSRWTLLFLGLSAGASAWPLSLQAEPKPSILESLGLPKMFKSNDSNGSSAARVRPNYNGIQRPGSISPAARSAAKPTATGENSSNGLFPSMKGLGDLLGIDAPAASKPIGQSAEGIIAPPPPTLETAESRTPKATATRTNTATTKTAEVQQPIPAESPIRAIPTPEPDPAAIALTKKLPAATVKPSAKKPESQSSRRAWQGEQTASYSAVDDGRPQLNAEVDSLEVTTLIDRRMDVEEEEPSEIDNQTNQTPQETFDPQNPPLPVLLGQEDEAARQRLSIAERMAPVSQVPRVSQLPQLKVIQLPRASELQPPDEANSAEVTPASYLPPIISAEDARRLKAARGK